MRVSVGRRMLIGLTAVLLATALGVVCVFFTLIWPVGCGGDGGSPYKARASPAGAYCEMTRQAPLEPILYGLLLLPIWGTLVAGVIGMIKGRFQPLLWSTLASILSLVIIAAPMIVLDDRCTAEQRGRLPGTQCETYN